MTLAFPRPQADLERVRYWLTTAKLSIIAERAVIPDSQFSPDANIDA